MGIEYLFMAVVGGAGVWGGVLGAVGALGGAASLPPQLLGRAATEIIVGVLLSSCPAGAQHLGRNCTLARAVGAPTESTASQPFRHASHALESRCCKLQAQANLLGWSPSMSFELRAGEISV